MLGIDIVDLKDPLLKKRTNRSLELIKHQEDALIEHPLIFWMLWSAKEAVFKLQRKALYFSPSKIPIHIKENNSKIVFQSADICGKFELTEEYILSMCGDLSQIDFKIFKKESTNWSNDIRSMIVSFFKEKGHEYQVSTDELTLPIINPNKSPISISHHHRYGAIAFSKSLL